MMGRPSRIDEDLLRQMHAEDVTHREMAERLGVNRTSVQRRLYKLGLRKARTGPKSGERHPNWKGGLKWVGRYLYRYNPEHPNATQGGYMAEHRLIMERKLGRLLERKEVVHHRDGDPSNNDESNLEVFQTNGEHLAEELAGRVPNWSEDGKRRILEGARKGRANSPIPFRRIPDDQQVTQTSDRQKESL